MAAAEAEAPPPPLLPLPPTVALDIPNESPDGLMSTLLPPETVVEILVDRLLVRDCRTVYKYKYVLVFFPYEYTRTLDEYLVSRVCYVLMLVL